MGVGGSAAGDLMRSVSAKSKACGIAGSGPDGNALGGGICFLGLVLVGDLQDGRSHGITAVGQADDSDRAHACKGARAGRAAPHKRIDAQTHEKRVAVHRLPST